MGARACFLSLQQEKAVTSANLSWIGSQGAGVLTCCRGRECVKGDSLSQLLRVCSWLWPSICVFCRERQQEMLGVLRFHGSGVILD